LTFFWNVDQAEQSTICFYAGLWIKPYLGITGSGLFYKAMLKTDLADWMWGYDYSYKHSFLWYFRIWHVIKTQIFLK